LFGFDVLALHISFKSFVQSIKTKTFKNQLCFIQFKNEATSIGDQLLHLIICFAIFVQLTELKNYDPSTKQNILML
jgi:hypothetical protein